MTESTPGTAGWEPANDVERALLALAADDDRRGYFQLLAVSDLYLPQVVGGPPGPQQFVTMHVLEQTVLPVFTSVETLTAQVNGAANGYVVTNYPELRRKWPDPDWRLAINPGTPVDAYLSIETMAQAAMGELLVPTMSEMVLAAAQDEDEDRELEQLRAGADYPDDPDEALLAAARAGDVYGYVDRLLDTVVLIPTGRPVTAEEILEPGFPWRAIEGQAIEVFTNRAELDRSHPEPVPFVEVALPFALACWPPDHGLTVNPDGAATITLEPEQVAWLLTFGPPGEPD
jgi:hypothetical protein